MEHAAQETLDSLSVTTLGSVRQTVAGLSGAQAVAVAKSVMWNSKLLILDEPTAALGVAQTRQVLDLVRRLADRDLGVVIVSHNLHDVFEVADRITVLRLGQRGGAQPVGRRRSRRSCTPSPPARIDHVPGMADARSVRVMTTDLNAPSYVDAEPVVTPEEPLPPATPAELEAVPETLGGYVRRWWQGVRAGELGSLLIIVGLIIIAIVFGTLDDTFFTERNFTNLLLQMAPPGHDRHRGGVRAADRRDRPVGGLS